MSSFSFSWDSTPLAWPARLGAWDWRSEKFRTPIACKSGSNCCYKGVCSFVHPGEEGTGLKFFPGRSYQGEDGTECWESPVVRLIGRPSYYERRRLRLSWADWCARVGLPLPEPPARRPRLDLSAPAPAPQEVEVVATAEDEQQAAWTAYYQQVYAQQIAYQQWLFHQQQLTEAQEKNLLGDALYLLVQDALAGSLADRETIGWTGPGFTAGKFTGMLLEGCSVEELRQLVAGGAGSAELCELMLEACEVLAAAQKPQVTEEVRAAPPSATGLVGLAACADDTVRQLLEDVRRIDAGLPLRELPPSITSYEPLPNGKVRVVKTAGEEAVA